jgi:two-component system, cell cycle sensor histidine kinase and response regulator CckA
MTHPKEDRPLPAAALPPLVLVVDDDPNICRLFKLILEAAGYRALTAANGAEALELYRRHRAEVRVVVTDLAMPILDGQGTIRELHRLDPRLPIFVVSSDPTAKSRAGELGDVRDFLPKPFTPAQFLPLLRQALAEQE